MSQAFSRWLEEVDTAMASSTEGLTHEDFVDIAWRDLYDAGTDPDEACDELAEEDPIFAAMWVRPSLERS